MKKYYLVLFLIVVLTFIENTCVNAQNYNFEMPCDTLTSQMEMNVCTYEKSKIIDSLISFRYNCFKLLLEKDLKKVLLENDTSEIEYYKNVIRSVEDSQKSYVELSKSNMSFYSILYEGGTIRNMMVNLSAISDGIDRLKRLDDFIESLSWSDKVCK